MDYVLILFVNDIFAVIILISCSILGIIIIIYFQFYYITAIAALPEGAHGVLRNVVNLVDIIRLILIIFWVSSPSKSSYCGTSVTTVPSLSVGQWRRCSWVSSESSHLRHWVVFSPTLKLLLTSSILDRAVNVNCFSLIEKLLWLDCRYDWSFSSLCVTRHFLLFLSKFSSDQISVSGRFPRKSDWVRAPPNPSLPSTPNLPSLDFFPELRKSSATESLRSHSKYSGGS